MTRVLIKYYNSKIQAITLCNAFPFFPQDEKEFANKSNKKLTSEGDAQEKKDEKDG